MALPPGFGGPNLPPPPGDGSSPAHNRLLIENLQRRITMLENRLARLENVIRLSDHDVEIVVEGNLKIEVWNETEIDAIGPMRVSAATLSIDGGTINAASAITTFTGIVQCDTLIASTVAGSSYTPGAGNLW